jgi:hypothetical protein
MSLKSTKIILIFQEKSNLFVFFFVFLDADHSKTSGDLFKLYEYYEFRPSANSLLRKLPGAEGTLASYLS